jgi:hypothetical protein
MSEGINEDKKVILTFVEKNIVSPLKSFSIFVL